MLDEIDIKIWKTLSTCSKRALIKTKKNYGKPYFYNPRGHLLERIANDFGISKEDALNRLMNLRKELLARIS